MSFRYFAHPPLRVMPESPVALDRIAPCFRSIFDAFLNLFLEVTKLRTGATGKRGQRQSMTCFDKMTLETGVRVLHCLGSEVPGDKDQPRDSLIRRYRPDIVWMQDRMDEMLNRMKHGRPFRPCQPQ